MTFPSILNSISTISQIVALAEQEPPPWLGVHMLGAPGRETGEYDCRPGRVRIEIADPGFQGAPEVIVWRVGDRDVTDDLARWNHWLEELAIYGSFSVSCRGEWIGVSLQGWRHGDGAEHSISIMWRDGEMWRAPLGSDDWLRAEQEGWFPPHNPSNSAVDR